MSKEVSGSNEPEAKFPFGRVVVTANAKSVIPDGEIFDALSRHGRGDWGTLTASDWKANDLALKDGDRLVSAYVSSNEIKFLIITEADRSFTTILLPEDY
jgi:hypothetical protein